MVVINRVLALRIILASSMILWVWLTNGVWSKATFSHTSLTALHEVIPNFQSR